MLLNRIEVLRVYTETDLSFIIVFQRIKGDIQGYSLILFFYFLLLLKNNPKYNSVLNAPSLPGQVDTFEPVEHIDTLLRVQHPHEAGEDGEDGGLRGPEAVHDQGGLVGVGGG